MAATDGGAGAPQDQRATADQTAAEGAGTGDLARTDSGTAADSGAGTGDLARTDSAAAADSVTAGGDGGRSVGESGGAMATRASDRERDAVVQRVQDAFAEGRLNDDEFDERSRAALTARTHADLDALLADLPATPAAAGPAPVLPGPGRFAVALKSSVRRAGRWRVPERYTTVVYKGGGWLDLRAAELSGPVTTFLAVAYKSRVTILVPPNVRVEMTGLGVTQDAHDEDPGYRLSADAPVIHVRGIAYKGTVEIATRPPERPALRGWGRPPRRGMG
jgi:Domain of unknown function (DUF1707)